MDGKVYSYIYYFGYQYILKSKIQKVQKLIHMNPDITKISNGFKRERLSVIQGSQMISDSISRGVPFFAGRFGASELNLLRQIDFGKDSDKQKALSQLCLWSGFFPEKMTLTDEFYDIMKQSISNIDLIGTWSLPMEDYYVNKYTSIQCKTAFMDVVDPRTCLENPWSAVLKGKKVLVVHPFKDTIEKQYARREYLYDNPGFLPEFDLQVFRAVQTIAGEKDDRFASWFEALDYMMDEIAKLEFDVALIGCGAYGFPLGSRIKKMGKQAIHVGGILQTLFGISGGRWDIYKDGRNAKFRNEYWVYPSEDETPKNASAIEGGAYWKFDVSKGEHL